jgi:hypothetical protein
MNQVHNITTTFMDFPAELLLKIVGYLDAYDLVRARKVRRIFYPQISANGASPDM